MRKKTAHIDRIYLLHDFGINTNQDLMADSHVIRQEKLREVYGMLSYMESMKDNKDFEAREREASTIWDEVTILGQTI